MKNDHVIASPERLGDALRRRLKPGTVVGRFVIRPNPGNESGLLDVGGMGFVFSAWEQELERDCVLKVLAPHMHPRFRPDLDCAAMLRDEAMTLVRLGVTDSSAFLHVYGRGGVTLPLEQDVGGPIELPYYAMELLRGIHFQKIVARTRRANASLGWYFLLTLAHKMASALAVAHSLDIVHRDLKPDNVFLHTLPHRWEVKLIDFGIARIRGQRRRVGTGTDRYAAPELVKGTSADEDAEEDTQSDIYPLGLIMYELATGRGPFEVPKGEFASAHVWRKPPLLSDFRADSPLAFVHVVDAALAKNPRERPTAAEVVALLHKALSEMPEEAMDAQIRAILPPGRHGVRPQAATRSLASGPSHSSHEESAVASLRSEVVPPASTAGEPTRPIVTLPLPLTLQSKPTPVKYPDTEPDREPFGAFVGADPTAPPKAAPSETVSSQPRFFRSTAEMFELWEDDTRYVSSPFDEGREEPLVVSSAAKGAPPSPIDPAPTATTEEPVVNARPPRAPRSTKYRRAAFAVVGGAVGVLLSAWLVRSGVLARHDEPALASAHSWSLRSAAPSSAPMPREPARAVALLRGSDADAPADSMLPAALSADGPAPGPPRKDPRQRLSPTRHASASVVAPDASTGDLDDLNREISH